MTEPETATVAGTTPDAGTTVADAVPTQTSTMLTTETTSTGESTADAETATVGVPEKYEFVMPEGFTLDEKALGDFTPVLKELDLDNPKAQKLVDAFAQFKKAEVLNHQATMTAMEATWRESIEKDPSIGGAALLENLGAARALISKYDTNNELADFLETSRAGNNPAVVRFLVKLGKADAEAKMHSGTRNATEAKPAVESVLYPSMAEKPN